MHRNHLLFSLAGFLLLLFLFACQQSSHQRPLSSADSLRAIQESMYYRAVTDSFFSTSPQSPFYDGSGNSTQYRGLRRFRIDPKYYVRSKLYKYDNPEVVMVSGTKGEGRKQIRYGYFLINIDGKEAKLNVYKFTPEEIAQAPQYRNYLSVWFTDETTGSETYEVGRYLNVEEEQADPEYEYVINFNNAYNPYCAYNPRYTCAIPTKEDHLDLAISAGEMKYHE